MTQTSFETRQDLSHRYFVWLRWLRIVNRHRQALSSGDVIKRTTDTNKFQPLQHTK